MADALTGAILRGPAGAEIGAFFDFDGTLIHGYSASVYYRDRLRRFDVSPVEAARTLRLGLRGLTDEDSFERFMTVALQAFAGRSEDEMDELGERLFVQSIAGAIYPEAWSLVQAHRLMGHTLVLASSATRFQVAPAARELGFEHVLTSPLESEDGILTGRAGGPLLWRRGKADAVRAFAAEHDIDLSRSYAYSNGDEDVPFLETVGNPRPVNPEGRLARVAAERGWPARRFAARGRPGLGGVARTAALYGGMLWGMGAGMTIGLLNGSRRKGLDMATGLSADIGLGLGGIDVDVQGAEHLFSHRPAVFIFNHQSQLDVPLLCKLLRGGFTGVAKQEVRRQPVWGQLFAMADVAFVERGNTAQAKRALAPAVHRLREGTSLVIAPEGTRSYTPRLGRFKKGAFHVAMQAEVPVVPIVLRNAGAAMWRGSKTIRPATVDVAVHPPIDVTEWKVAELDERVAEVRQLYLDTLDRWPGSPAERLAAVS
jgi:HAD superfamily hydrolase (TIGR01490 family)